MNTPQLNARSRTNESFPCLAIIKGSIKSEGKELNNENLV